MDEAKIALVREWLFKARNDLASAQKLAAGPDPYLDTAIYHCQQAAEKTLKAFLVFHDQRFEKTHDLRLLLQQALSLEHSLSDLKDSAAHLTPYAAAFRYPDETLEPSREEFESAFEAARQFISRFHSLLPPGAHPA